MAQSLVESEVELVIRLKELERDPIRQRLLGSELG